MELIHTVDWMKQVARQARSEGSIVGLVPTMGAFHGGHLALFETARAENDAVAVSLFVNPAQFDDPTDLVTYPRDEARDLRPDRARGGDV